MGPFRIGHGYDIHRLAPNGRAGPGRALVLGGVAIDHDRGPVAHSDGDALLHAVADALLGALGQDDLGTLFPDTDPENDGRDSAEFVAEAVRRVSGAGFELINLDATVVCERPRLRAHRAAIRGRLAELLGVGADRVNVKGKSHEGLDSVGAGEAIEVHCVALLGRA